MDDNEVNAQHVIDNLRELQRRTGDANGAQRLAWSDTWIDARAFLEEQLAHISGVAVRTDEAGNMWAHLEGQRPETVVFGSHLDSVPDGGWLDGAFGVMTGLEVLRALAVDETPACSVALVDWADEEGARFGRSVFGSSVAAGSLTPTEVEHLTDQDGVELPDALARCGVQFDRLEEAADLARVAAYLETHIEQGPVLEAEGIPVAAVLGTVGMRRHRVTFTGRSAHAGTTPMDRRNDPVLAAARTAIAVRDAALRHDGVGTVGSVVAVPGIVTAVAEEATVLVDQRHLDPVALDSMHVDARSASEAAAAAEGCEVAWEPLLVMDPRPFDDDLVEVVRQSCRDACGQAISLPSGALHDATPLASRVPTAMLFVSSTHGISHNRDEDTPEPHLKMAVEVFGRIVRESIRIVSSATPGKA